MKPSEVTVDQEDQIRTRLNAHHITDTGRGGKSIKLVVGDHVRISKYRNVFSKGYMPNWTEEMFQVSEVVSTSSPKRYKLTDYNKEKIIGTFYREELQKVKSPEWFKIEKIIRYRNRKREALVKWLGYPASMASWIKVSDMKNLIGGKSKRKA